MKRLRDQMSRLPTPGISYPFGKIPESANKTSTTKVRIVKYKKNYFIISHVNYIFKFISIAKSAFIHAFFPIHFIFFFFFHIF